jgi:pimeloyl-ACP methyl ester carboxylesterase
MANGFSLTRHDGLPQFAEAFAAAGMATLLFDHRNFGDSSSKTPQRYRAREQVADWRAAIAHVRSREEIDSSRLALWGYSLSAGHAVHVASEESAIAAVLATCPFVDGLFRVVGTPTATTVWIVWKAMQELAGRHVRIPVTAPVGGRAAMAWQGEFEGFRDAIPAGSPWRNEITPGYALTLALFQPVRRAKMLNMPVWVGMGQQDITTSTRATRRLAEHPPHAELHTYDFDHFGPLTGTGFQDVAADQIDFLRRSEIIPAHQ